MSGMEGPKVTYLGAPRPHVNLASSESNEVVWEASASATFASSWVTGKAPTRQGLGVIAEGQQADQNTFIAGCESHGPAIPFIKTRSNSKNTDGSYSYDNYMRYVTETCSIISYMSSEDRGSCSFALYDVIVLLGKKRQQINEG
jgi:hypothetical protein